MALRKAHIVTKLLAFTCNFTLLHNIFLIQGVIVHTFDILVNISTYTKRIAILDRMFVDLTLLQIGMVLGAILISMSIHEALHAFMAHYLGDSTAHDEGRLTINPLAHIDIFMTVLLPISLIALGLPPFFIAKPVPFRPDMVRYGEFGAALIGVIGPLSNLVLAAIAGAILSLGGFSITGHMADFLFLFLSVNVAFFVFNMIPFPPLDGSRLLYAFAPDAVRRVMAQVESLGLMGIVIFMLVAYPLIGSTVVNVMQSVYDLLLW